MECSAPKPTVVTLEQLLESAQNNVLDTTARLIAGEQISPLDMLRVLRVARLIRAEVDSLDQVLSMMGQKKP